MIKNKEVSLTLTEDDSFETASEVKFTSMFLDYFPIKYRKFFKNIYTFKNKLTRGY